MAEKKGDGIACLVKGMLITKNYALRMQLFEEKGIRNTGWVFNHVNMTIIL